MKTVYTAVYIPPNDILLILGKALRHIFVYRMKLKDSWWLSSITLQIKLGNLKPGRDEE